MEFDSWESQFEGRKLEKYKNSWEYLFYREIFNNIDENYFMVIYSKEASRPNSPINSMVAALILLTAFEWTYEELSDNIDFNVLTRHTARTSLLFAILGFDEYIIAQSLVLALFILRKLLYFQ